MPVTRISPDLEMNYLIDDYTDPWREADTVLMLHGNGESSAAWFAWVPHLARRFRVVRPDMRGFGASTPMPRDYPWSIDIIIDDYLRLMQALGVTRVHLAGSKLGGTIARAFAARHPESVLTLTVAGTPPPRRDVAARVSAMMDEFETKGIEHWARRTTLGRLGSKCPPEAVEWWIKMMARSPVSSQIGFTQKILTSDITADLPRIACPTLVITTEGSALGSVEETRAWQQKIPRSVLLVLPGDSFHVAASAPDRCARETRDFISRATAERRNHQSAHVAGSARVYR